MPDTSPTVDLDGYRAVANGAREVVREWDAGTVDDVTGLLLASEHTSTAIDELLALVAEQAAEITRLRAQPVQCCCDRRNDRP